MFLTFSTNAFAVQDFDYYFGTFLVPTPKITAQTSVSTANTQITQLQSQTQIASMQANLNQMKATLASLNSDLIKPKSDSRSNNLAKEPAKESVKVVSAGIPLLLSEDNKEEEKKTLSVFASLIPPDVRNSPFLATHLTILTLGLFGVILYLYLIRRQEKKHVIQ